MGSKISLRRVARRSIGLLFAIILVTAPALVLAGHRFPDVPSTHPFHDPISAIAEAGITAGFGDGTYRPSDPVTRQSMAAFMHRGFGRTALAFASAPLLPRLSAGVGIEQTGTPVSVRELTITAPGASNAFGPQQMVHLQGNVHFFTQMSDVQF